MIGHGFGVSPRHLLIAATIAALVTLALDALASGGGFASFSKPRTAQVGNDPLGITAGDFNRDGRLDLAVTNFQSPLGITILKNRGNGRFKPAQTIPLAVQPD